MRFDECVCVCVGVCVCVCVGVCVCVCVCVCRDLEEEFMLLDQIDSGSVTQIRTK